MSTVVKVDGNLPCKFVAVGRIIIGHFSINQFPVREHLVSRVVPKARNLVLCLLNTEL